MTWPVTRPLIGSGIARRVHIPTAPARAWRWAALGLVLGLAIGAVAWLPAAWLSRAVASATDQRLLLADAEGTVWSGSAVAVLTGGPGSQTASALPGRLHWTMGWSDGAIELALRQACCLSGEPRLRIRPGIGRQTVALRPAPGAADIGRWPAGWLAGLGTPWNTLELDGQLRLAGPGIAVEQVQGRWRTEGQAVLELAGVASRLSTLPVLGSYTLTLQGTGDTLGLVLATEPGSSLLLNANGQWTAGGLRLRGEATAAAGYEAALANLLNIIGRREGARSILAIG